MPNSRVKGRAGEQECCRILRKELPMFHVHRNWMAQSAEGGADVVIPGWAIEIKRHKTAARINDWWVQAAMQAVFFDGLVRPVLLYRVDRGEWMAMMSMFDLRPDLQSHTQVTMKISTWCTLVRSEIDANA